MNEDTEHEEEEAEDDSIYDTETDETTETETAEDCCDSEKPNLQVCFFGTYLIYLFVRVIILIVF